MFDNLPLHIKEMIFTRVKYIDLFETARVSQEWWVLTMASFNRLIHEADDYLLDQVEFCNQMMPKEEPWEWWMLMEFTKSKRLHLKKEHFLPLKIGPDPRLIEYYKAKGIAVRHLTLDSYVFKDGWRRYRRCPPNLKELFPDLISLNLFHAKFEDGKRLILPKNLKHVRLSSVEFKQAANLSDIFPEPGMVKVLKIDADHTPSIIFDSVKFDNLTHLSLYVPNLSRNDLTKAASVLKRFIGDCNMLKSLSLERPLITKAWFRILPSRVVNIRLYSPLLDVDVQTVFGEQVFYDRLLLMYICKDWTSVHLFKSQYLALSERRMDADDFDFGEKANDPDFVDYVCRPSQMEEEICVEVMHSKTDIKKLITENNENLVLTKLDCKIHAKGQNYAALVPKTVRDFSLVFDYCNSINVNNLFEDCSVVEKLKLDEDDILGKGRVTGFPRMVNLRQLEIITGIDHNQLASIFRLCPLLEKVTLKEAEKHAFAYICDNVSSESVKCVTIIKGNDSIDDILKALPSLQSLTLVDPPKEALLDSNFDKVNKLNYFKLECSRNNKIVQKFACLRLPFMVFACTNWAEYYVVSKNSTLINEINDILLGSNSVEGCKSFFLAKKVRVSDVLVMFTKGISIQCLRNQYPVVFSIEEFCEKVNF